MIYKESAQFIYENGQSAIFFEDLNAFWTHAITHTADKGHLLEFGVFKGESINFFSKVLKQNNDPRVIYGFDSFEGLSEDWGGTDMQKSTFDLKGILPKVNENVVLVKGWIDDTLPEFIDKELDKNDGIAFMHIDMDTYSPTKVIFEQTVKFLKPDSVIVFDELLGYPGWKQNEFKVLIELLAPYWEYEFISFCEPKLKNRVKSKYVRAAIRIVKRK